MRNIRLSPSFQLPSSPDTCIDVLGERVTDSVTFAVRVYIRHDDIDGVRSEQAIAVAVASITGGLLMLQEYRDCSCIVGNQCDRHSHINNIFG